MIIFKSTTKSNTNRFPVIARSVSEMYSVDFRTIYQIGWRHQYGVCVETGDCYLLSKYINNKDSQYDRL